MITLRTKKEKIKISKNLVELKCECCGKKLELEYSEDFRHAVSKARTVFGWVNRFYDDKWHHFCSSKCCIAKTTNISKETERCKPYTELPVYTDAEIDIVLGILSARVWRASEQFVKCDKCGKKGCQQRIKMDAQMQTLKREIMFYENYKTLKPEEQYKDIPRLV